MKERLIKLKNSIDLNVLDTQNTGPVVLLLHFSSGTAQMWNGIIPYLKDTYRVIAPDLRGHGKSSKPETGYHIDNMAEDIYLLLKELDIEQCHIVGSSLGAEVGVSFAASHPEMVLSLVSEGALFNEFGEYGLFNGSENEIQEEKEKRRSEYKRSEQPLFDSKEEMIEEKSQFFKEAEVYNDYFKQFIETNICSQDGKFTFCHPIFAANEYVVHYLDFRFEEYYKKISSPVLFLLSEDEWKNEKIRDIVEKFAQFIEDSTIKYIEGGMHAYIWMQYPEIAGKLISDFINNNSI